MPRKNVEEEAAIFFAISNCLKSLTLNEARLASSLWGYCEDERRWFLEELIPWFLAELISWFLAELIP